MNIVHESEKNLEARPWCRLVTKEGKGWSFQKNEEEKKKQENKN